MNGFYNKYWKEKTKDELDDFSYKLPTISKIIPRINNLKILDYGCGTGKTFQELIKINPGAKYYGVDISDYAIKKISKKFPAYKFFVVKEEEKVPLKSGSIDLITCFDVIEHVYNTEWLLLEFFRLLKPKGKLILSTPYHGFIKNLIISTIAFDNVFDPFGPHIRFFTERSLKSGLEKYGFRIIKKGYYGRFYPISNGFYIITQRR